MDNLALKPKVIIIIFSTYLLLSLIIFSIFWYFFTYTTLHLEKLNAQVEIIQLEEGLNDETHLLISQIDSWEIITKKYFSLYNNKEYLHINNLNYSSLKKLDIDLIIYINNSGKTINSKLVENKALRNLTNKELKELLNFKDYKKNGSFNNIRSKLTHFNNKIILSVAKCNYNNNKSLTNSEVIIFGKYFKYNLPHSLYEIFPVNSAEAQKIIKETPLLLKNEIVIKANNYNTYNAYKVTSLSTPDNPVLFKLTLPKIFLNETFNKIVFILLLVVLIVGYLTLILIEKFVVKRFSEFNKLVNSLDIAKDVPTRLNFPGNDDLSKLVNCINKMLETIEATKKREQKINDQLIMSMYAVEKSLALTFWLDYNNNIIYANDALCKTLEYSYDEITTMTLPQIDKYVDPQNYKYLKEKLEKEHSIWIETKFTTKSNKIIDVKVNPNMYIYKGNYYVLSIGYDVTERNKDEKDLLETKNTLQVIYDNLFEGLVIYSIKNNKIIGVNQRYLDLINYTEEEYLNVDLLERFKNHGNEIYNRFLDHINKKITKTSDIRLMKKGFNDSIYVDLQTSVIDYHDDKIMLLFLNDVTERKLHEDELSKKTKNLEQLNLQLVEANKHKSRFLSSMSHEFRTPLNAILGCSQILKSSYFGEINPKQLEYLEFIHTGGKHLLSLVNDLLDISKIDAGAIELYISEFKVDEYITSMVNMLNAQFAQKELIVETKIDNPNLIVRADQRKCNQILLNLLSNAIKYSNKGGKIIVKSEKISENKLKISIIDFGVGIKKENLKNIFSEFYQVDQVRDENLGGTGIGLPLTERLVKKHGEEIGVESDVGFGSTFWFTMPIIN